MKHITYNIKKILVILFCVTSYMLDVTYVSAQALPLQVAPTRQEITVNPGEQSGATVKFFNLGDQPITGIINAVDFVVEGPEGKPRLLDSTEAPTKYAASNWFDLPYERISIAANDKVTAQIRINVPANANPGGRYVAVYFEPGGEIPKSEGGQRQAGTAISSRLASLVYLKVAGPITENAFISKFLSDGFFEYGPVNISAEILNRGDYHIRPKGVVMLTNMFGGLIAQEKLKEQNIFPDSSRSYNLSIGKKWLAGRYKVELNSSYGDSGRVLNKILYVWVFPWRVALIIMLALLLLFLLGRNIYNKIIVKEALLEKELEEEKEEIEKLRETLRKRKD